MVAISATMMLEECLLYGILFLGAKVQKLFCCA
jgi:hypothetical protein